MRLSVAMHFDWLLDPENPRLLILRVEEEEWKRVWKTLFFPHLSALSLAESRGALEEQFAALEAKLCRDAGFKLLALKGHFEQELRQKLLAKRFSGGAVESALLFFHKSGYLDEGEEARRLVERLRKKGYGPRLITARLQQKGVEGALEFGGESVAALRALIEKKYRDVSRERVIAALLRRGFSYPSILDALKSGDSYNEEKGR